MTFLSPLIVALSLASAILPAASTHSATASAAPLVLETKIPLGRIEGRIDHLALDPRRGRLYVAELGNDTVGIVDLRTRRLVRNAGGFDQPQGIAYEPSTDTVYVANGGDGSVGVFRADDFAAVGRLAVGKDADNVRVDRATGRVYIGYGAALAIVDPSARTKVAEFALKGHPEGFQLDPAGDRIFANVPDAREIAVLDLSARRQLASWSTGSLEANYPLALDGGNRSVIVVFRRPARLERFDVQDGRRLNGTGVCADADDVFVDAHRHRVYVICGEGAVESFDSAKQEFTRVGRLETTPGSRTGLFVPELDRLLVAVRAAGRESAAVWILRPEP
jgi:hypothetical protein